MASDINVVALTGRLVADAELKQTNSGLSISTIRLANNQSKKNSQSGQWEEQAHFFNIKLFGKQAEVLQQYLTKGKMIAVSGRITQHSYKPQNEEKNRSVIEIIADSIKLLSSGGGQGNSGGGNQYNSNKQSSPAAEQNYEQPANMPEPGYPDNTPADDLGGPMPDDEIPF